MSAKKDDLADQLSYRALRLEDAVCLLQVEQSAHIHPWSLESFEELLARDDVRAFGFCSGSRVIGFFVYQSILDEGHLLNLCVEQGYQGRGIGRQLLEACLADAMSLGLRRMLLEVRESNTIAVQLYEKKSFQVVGVRRNYYPSPHGREDALLMTCEIGDAVL